jgi:hypothetical protein
MEDAVVKNKIIENDLVPENIKGIVAAKESKISISSLTKERVVSLYGLRKERLLHEEGYKKIIIQIEKMLSILKNYRSEIVLMINIVKSDSYVIIFADESVDQILAVLDLTGLGNTTNYLDTLFS